MNIFNDKFSTMQVAQATMAGNNNIQNWVRRNLVIGIDKIEGGGSQGRHRRFSFYGAMEIGLADALIGAGMADLSRAFNAAYHFAHFGEGPVMGKPERAPGCPFNGIGRTLLVAGKDRADEVFVTDNKSAWELYTEIRQCGQGAVVIDAGDVFDQVTSGLGYHPEAVIELAYRKVAAD